LKTFASVEIMFISVVDTGGNLPPVSTTPVANLPPVSWWQKWEQYQAADTLK
jgi:hypothetical protein